MNEDLIKTYTYVMVKDLIILIKICCSMAVYQLFPHNIYYV